jgi:DNA-binding NarL/FixJ family response regulator
MPQQLQEKIAGNGKSRILIVDDHPIVRQGLAKLINREDNLVVCGQAEDAYSAMKAVRNLRPDMVIVDISLGDTSGIELIKDIKVTEPDVPVLVLSMHDETLYTERALRAGAKGYIMKHEGTEKLIAAIRTVLKGQLYVSDKMASRILRKLVAGRPDEGVSPLDKLSDRELEVFLLIGKGHKTKQISEQLHLSVKTVETYRSHIKEKLDLADATELLQHAIQWVNSDGLF